MTITILNQLLERLQREVPDVFLVQIGAMDGVSFDPISPFVARYNWKGVVVEPLMDHFVRLCMNYSDMDNLAFENVAITEQQEVRKINRIPLDAIHDSHLPEWTKGISSFFLDRNAIGGKGCTDNIYKQLKSHIVEEDVDCITLDTLLSRNNVSKIDLLQLDTEGYDYKILKQLDFTRFKPYIINMEFILLPDDEKKECLQLLEKQGYKYARSGQQDLVATTWDQVPT